MKSEIVLLDKLEATRNGCRTLKIGPALFLCFPNSSSEPIRRGVCSCAEQFVVEIDDEGLFRAQKNKTLTAVTKTALLEHIGRTFTADPDKDFELSFTSHLEDGKHPETTGIDFGAFVATRDEEQRNRTAVQWRTGDAPGVDLPMDFGDGLFGRVTFYHSNAWLVYRGADYLIDLFRRWCELLQPIQGHFGFGIQYTVYGLIYTSSAVDAFPYIRRFPGLTYGADSALRIQRNRAMKKDFSQDGIWDINWLTVVSDHYLGKSEALRKNIAGQHNGVTVHPYRGGVILQAGDMPSLGDYNRKLVPSEYVEVEKIIQPVRFSEITDAFVVCPATEDALAVSRDYMTRFSKHLG